MEGEGKLGQMSGRSQILRLADWRIGGLADFPPASVFVEKQTGPWRETDWVQHLPP